MTSEKENDLDDRLYHIENSIRYITDKLINLSQFENKLILEMDRCKSYADKMENILIESSRVKGEMIESMNQQEERINDSIASCLSSDILMDVKKKLIQRLA